VYVDEGAVVTIKAEALGGDGEAITADRVEIWLGFDQSAPQLVVADAASGMLEYPAGGPFSYGCRVTYGDEAFFTGWRTVAVGDPADNFPSAASFPAIPILLNGSIDEKIDIVFFADRDEYTAFDDPAFVEDVGLLLQGGYFTIPWFAWAQDRFNFWIAKDMANSGPDPDDDDASDGISCLREAPDNYGKRYAFADSSAIVHRSSCRDNAGSPGLFTVEMDLNRLQVVAHETGHRPFGLSDEYCCDGGYFTRGLFDPPYPNMFRNEDKCRAKASERHHDPDLCRALIEDDTDKDWWLFEPDFRGVAPNPRDLMQQSGCDRLADTQNCRRIEPNYSGPDADPNGVVACAFPLELYVGDPDGTADSGDESFWACRRKGDATNALWQSVGSIFDRYEPGPSEVDRLRWFIAECVAGRC